MKISKIVLGIVMIVLGIALIVGILAATGFDLSSLGTAEPVTNEYKIDKKFKNISIDVDTADVTFVHANEKAARVVCEEDKKVQHTAVVEGDMLKITVRNKKSWIDYLGFTTKDLKLTLYLPGTGYESIDVKTDTGAVVIPKEFTFGSAKIETDTGDVDFQASAAKAMEIETDTGLILLGGVSAGSLQIKSNTGDVSIQKAAVEGPVSADTDTGHIRLSDLTCMELKIDTDTGKVVLTKTIADGSMDIKTSTGDVLLENSDAAELTIKTSTGDVSGTLLTGKDFETETSTGKVSVPKTSGGKCKVKTSTGDIEIEVLGN